MNQQDLRQIVERLQDLIHSETGARVGSSAEEVLAKILTNVSNHNWSGIDGFSGRAVTILLADIRGFTSISTAYPPDTVLKVLNRCLITMSEIVFQHRGRIDKFMGDSIMAIFDGADSAETAARHAVLCGVDMQLAMEELNEYYKQLDLPELYLGIGVNAGTVMAGVLGSSMYSTHTVIGQEVNLASRIESFSLRGQVLISESAFELCGGFVETADPIEVHVKGKADPVRVREVVAIPSLAKNVPRREIRRSPRVAVSMPLSYHVIEDKIVSPRANQGTILDIGYHGVLVETDRAHPPSSELKFDLDLPLARSRATNVYAKVVGMQRTGTGYTLGLEFTSLTTQDSRNIQQFVQMLMQGGSVK